MVNRRTQEIFGRTPKDFIEKKHIYSMLIIVLLAFSVFLYTSSKDDQQVPIITTKATVPTSGENPSSPEDTTETTTLEEPEKEFYEYGGKCSVDVKKAQDDVYDVNNYLNEYQEQHNALQEEYNQKTTDLDEEYLPELERLQRDIEKAQEDLIYVEAKLDDVREICEP